MKALLRELSLATSVAALALVVDPARFGLVVRAWLLIASLLVLGAFLSAVLVRFPVEPAGLRHDRPGTLIRPVGEVRHVRDIDQASDFLVAVDYQLFPFLRDRLRDIAAQRLLARHNIDLERDSGRARRLLDAELWDIVRPAAPSGRGEGWGTISVAQLATIVPKLEKL
jgi:hypothetical protein